MLITRPNVVSDLLMFEPSLSLSPRAPVLVALSDPARSTKEILETFDPVTPDALSLQKNKLSLVRYVMGD